MGFSRLDVDINLIAASGAGGGRVEAFRAAIKEGYLSVEGLLAHLDVRQTPCSKGVLIDQSSGPPVLAPGQLLQPRHPCNCDSQPRAIPRYLADLYLRTQGSLSPSSKVLRDLAMPPAPSHFGHPINSRGLPIRRYVQAVGTQGNQD